MRALIVKDPSLAGKVQTLYESSGWAVVQSHAPGKASAVVFRLIGSNWVPDRSGKVKLSILGPQPGATAPKLPQVAIEFSAKTPFVESALWVDGTELVEKGGGSPTRGTIYGAPAAKPEGGRARRRRLRPNRAHRHRRRLGLQRRLIRAGSGSVARRGPDLGVLVTALLEVERP